jgi:hypothetical protein
MSVLESVLAQYEKNKQATSGNNNFSEEERMKKYFTTVLGKGVTTEERRIRILPPADGTTPFVEVKFHEVQVGGKWVKLWDPAQEGKKSPLNEVAEGLKMTGDPNDAELAKSYYSRKFFIVKVIDRNHEQDGPKFWRFKFNSKGDGAIDKILPIWRNKGDITDPEKGRDLILTLTLTKSGKGKEYTVVSSVIPEDIGPLSTDPEQAKVWLDNKSVWSDVYSKKGEDYLEMVAKGETPKWDRDAKKWVSDSTGEININGTGASATASPTIPTVDPQDTEEPSDELPF